MAMGSVEEWERRRRESNSFEGDKYVQKVKLNKNKLPTLVSINHNTQHIRIHVFMGKALNVELRSAIIPHIIYTH